MKGEAVLSVWNDFEDAYAAGYEQFAPEPFLAQPIDARDLTRLAPYLAVADAAE